MEEWDQLRTDGLQSRSQVHTTNSFTTSNDFKRPRTRRDHVVDVEDKDDEQQIDIGGYEEKAIMMMDESTTSDGSVAAAAARYGPYSAMSATNESTHTESPTKMDKSIHLDQYSYQLKSGMEPSSNSAGSLTTLLLDAAMDLGDTALCHQFATLLFMRHPPLNLNLKSMIYGDTIGMRLFHLLQRIGYTSVPHEVDDFDDDSDWGGGGSYEYVVGRARLWKDRCNALAELTGSSVLRPHDQQMKELMVKTIDPHITNREGQTMLHVISNSTYNSRFDLATLTKDLILSLIERGANLFARDHSGKVVIIELARNYELLGLDMDALISIIMKNNPVELLNVADDDGTTLLPIIGYTSTHADLLHRLVSDRDLFRRINLSSPEFGLVDLQAQNNTLRDLFIQGEPVTGGDDDDEIDDGHITKQRRRQELLDEVKRHEAIESAIQDWIQFNRTAVSHELDSFLIPDLSAIVNEYWIGCDPRVSTILVFLQSKRRHQPTQSDVLELPTTDRTLDSLWRHIVTRIAITQIHRYKLVVKGQEINTNEQVQTLTTGQRITIRPK